MKKSRGKLHLKKYSGRRLARILRTDFGQVLPAITILQLTGSRAPSGRGMANLWQASHPAAEFYELGGTSPA
ncbi:MAG: hypothetical protein LBG95_04840 [Treponema sp.]|nr:hypothetical protein [Treponema sp.]